MKVFLSLLFIFICLISFGQDYTSADGEITVTLRRTPANVVQAQVHINDPTGYSGIYLERKANQEKIFKKIGYLTNVKSVTTLTDYAPFGPASVSYYRIKVEVFGAERNYPEILLIEKPKK